ncbi:hypothetical protein QY97_00805 [Bacillus thermotolerans]|uniref:Uncharacterized protein n=1 Tax=Bacillus thermotolerans TaxID=1221996 RepID=A0A0F5HTR7_BACTR|nr:hypothetical protein QY97_00805 [Bacillus thermotolerans]KKB40615.1 hypothetical protein QY95_01189 [Bacillus thermotolerans]KKB41276.1 hypothetical protein QY96_02078 [Bacillus thermotolerans]
MKEQGDAWKGANERAVSSEIWWILPVAASRLSGRINAGS